MRVFLITIAVLYGLGCLASLFYGVVNMLFYAEYGEEDEDFQAGRIMTIYFAIWPYGLKKVIEFRLGRAEK